MATVSEYIEFVLQYLLYLVLSPLHRLRIIRNNQPPQLFRIPPHEIFYKPEILEQILLELPVTTLLVSRRTCKIWNSIIIASPRLNFYSKTGSLSLNRTFQSDNLLYQPHPKIITPLALEILTNFWREIAPLQTHYIDYTTLVSLDPEPAEPHRYTVRKKIAAAFSKYYKTSGVTPLVHPDLECTQVICNRSKNWRPIYTKHQWGWLGYDGLKFLASSFYPIVDIKDILGHLSDIIFDYTVDGLHNHPRIETRDIRWAESIGGVRREFRERWKGYISTVVQAVPQNPDAKRESEGRVYSEVIRFAAFEPYEVVVGKIIPVSEVMQHHDIEFD
ncbi:hypothetical protein TWF694_005068 [Orbilia ellipsospora]|uniref:F-box domain-containing protein n=1 Tax=Orbilia ellipsospora TaxID=2528407 RepID=A0AAV9WUL3_9PEZI